MQLLLCQWVLQEMLQEVLQAMLQETLHVLQSKDLMQQIAASLETHQRGQGYTPTEEQMNEITGI